MGTPVERVYHPSQDCVVLYGGITDPPQPSGEPPFSDELFVIRF